MSHHSIDPMSSRLPATVTINQLEVTPNLPPPVETGETPSSSPWARMFPEGATQDELKMFISTFIKTIMDQSKHENARWKEAMRKQKESLEGG